MDKLYLSEKIFIQKSKIARAGRGVFAKRDIGKGEIVETAPFIEVDDNVNGNTLATYFFFFGAKKEKKALALGFGSIYNHSSDANSTFKIENKEKIIIFTAIKPIKKDSEITIDYRGVRSFKEDKLTLWFD
jgi:uncharacterized protein